MHPQAFAYIAPRLVALAPKRVLEIGSADINASVQGLSLRALLPDAAWHGIDANDGPGVDEVASAAAYRTRRTFDCVVSTETAEHMENPRDLIECAGRYLVPGGTLLLTAASIGRAEHSADGGPLHPGEHYGAISPDALKAMLDGWADVEVEHNAPAGDVYARAVRKVEAKKDDD